MRRGPLRELLALLQLLGSSRRDARSISIRIEPIGRVGSTTRCVFAGELRLRPRLFHHHVLVRIIRVVGVSMKCLGKTSTASVTTFIATTNLRSEIITLVKLARSLLLRFRSHSRHY